MICASMESHELPGEGTTGPPLASLGHALLASATGAAEGASRPSGDDPTWSERRTGLVSWGAGAMLP